LRDIYNPREKGGIANPVDFIIDRDRTVHYVHRDEVAKRVRAAEIVRTLGPAAEGSRFATRFASRG